MRASDRSASISAEAQPSSGDGCTRDQHEVGGEQRGSHQPGDARRPVDHHMIDIARQLGRLTVERVARQADDAEQARRVLAGALRRPVERRTLGVRIDERDPLPLPAHSPARCSASVVLPTPPFWLRKATIIGGLPGVDRREAAEGRGPVSRRASVGRAALLVRRLPAARQRVRGLPDEVFHLSRALQS